MILTTSSRNTAFPSTIIGTTTIMEHNHDHPVSTTTHTTATKQKPIIYTPNRMDILCSQQRNYQAHPGNQTYALKIDSNLARYRLAAVADTNSKVAVMRITKKIVDEMKSEHQSRFLKPVRGLEQVAWEEISDSKARDKVRHALSFRNTRALPTTTPATTATTTGAASDESVSSSATVSDVTSSSAASMSAAVSSSCGQKYSCDMNVREAVNVLYRRQQDLFKISIHPSTTTVASAVLQKFVAQQHRHSNNIQGQSQVEDDDDEIDCINVVADAHLSFDAALYNSLRCEEIDKEIKMHVDAYSSCEEPVVVNLSTTSARYGRLKRDDDSAGRMEHDDDNDECEEYTEQVNFSLPPPLGATDICSTSAFDTIRSDDLNAILSQPVLDEDDEAAALGSSS
jgi:hypothetical protein